MTKDNVPTTNKENKLTSLSDVIRDLRGAFIS